MIVSLSVWCLHVFSLNFTSYDASRIAGFCLSEMFMVVEYWMNNFKVSFSLPFELRNFLNERLFLNRKVSHILDSLKIFCSSKHKAAAAVKKKTLKPTSWWESTLWMNGETKSVNLTEDVKDDFNYAIKWFSRVIYGGFSFKLAFQTATRRFIILLNGQWFPQACTSTCRSHCDRLSSF